MRSLILEGGARVAAGLYVDADGALASALGRGNRRLVGVAALRSGVRTALRTRCELAALLDGERRRMRLALRHSLADFLRARLRDLERVHGRGRGGRQSFSRRCGGSAGATALRTAGARSSAGILGSQLHSPCREIALDPLEGTALHLAQTGITRLLAHFPVGASSPPDRAEYNRLTAEEYDRLRDLLVLHYHATRRDDSPFWQRCRAMPLPDTLARRLELFIDSGRLTIGEEEHCGVEGWLAVLFGQGLQPRSFDPLAEIAPLENLRARSGLAGRGHRRTRRGVAGAPRIDRESRRGRERQTA